MKQLSYWANRHRYLAIASIILLEFLKGWIGFRIGSRFWPPLPGIAIELIVTVLVIAVLCIERNYRNRLATLVLPKAEQYVLRTRTAFFLLTASLLLSMLLGNRFQYVADPQDTSSLAWASTRRSSETGGSATSQSETAPNDIQKTRPLTRQELRHERKLAHQNHKHRPAHEKTVPYLLLFLAGLVLAWLGSALVCRLVCANQGVAAVLVGLVALGALGGGIYFLVKALRRNAPRRSVTN